MCLPRFVPVPRRLVCFGSVLLLANLKLFGGDLREWAVRPRSSHALFTPRVVPLPQRLYLGEIPHLSLSAFTPGPDLTTVTASAPWCLVTCLSQSLGMGIGSPRTWRGFDRDPWIPP